MQASHSLAISIVEQFGAMDKDTQAALAEDLMPEAALQNALSQSPLHAEGLASVYPIKQEWVYDALSEHAYVQVVSSLDALIETLQQPHVAAIQLTVDFSISTSQLAYMLRSHPSSVTLFVPQLTR